MRRTLQSRGITGRGIRLQGTKYQNQDGVHCGQRQGRFVQERESYYINRSQGIDGTRTKLKNPPFKATRERRVILAIQPPQGRTSVDCRIVDLGGPHLPQAQTTPGSRKNFDLRPRPELLGSSFSTIGLSHRATCMKLHLR